MNKSLDYGYHQKKSLLKFPSRSNVADEIDADDEMPTELNDVASLDEMVNI